MPSCREGWGRQAQKGNLPMRMNAWPQCAGSDRRQTGRSASEHSSCGGGVGGAGVSRHLHFWLWPEINLCPRGTPRNLLGVSCLWRLVKLWVQHPQVPSRHLEVIPGVCLFSQAPHGVLVCPAWSSLALAQPCLSCLPLLVCPAATEQEPAAGGGCALGGASVVSL